MVDPDINIKKKGENANQGNSSIWVAAVTALLTSLAAAVAGGIVFVVTEVGQKLLLKPALNEITAEVKRIGPGGIEGSTGSPDPGFFRDTGGKFLAIPNSDDSHICTANYFGNFTGSCAIHKDDAWRIRVDGSAACRVVCYRFKLK